MSPAVTSVFLSGSGPLVDRLRDWLREEYRVSTTTDPAAVPHDADPDVAIVDCRPPASDLDALSATVDDCRIAAVLCDPPSGAADPLPVDEVLVEPLSQTRVLRTVVTVRPPTRLRGRAGDAHPHRDHAGRRDRGDPVASG